MTFDESLLNIQHTLSEEKALEAFRLLLINEKISCTSSKSREVIGIAEFHFIGYTFWICYDIRKLEVLELNLSKNCNEFDALSFLNESLSKCVNIPVIVTEGQSYFDWAISKINMHTSHSKKENLIQESTKINKLHS